MREAIGLNRVKTLEIENGLQQAIAGRVPVEHCEKVGPDRRADGGVTRKKLGEGAANGGVGGFRTIETLPFADPAGAAFAKLQTLLREYGGDIVNVPGMS